MRKAAILGSIALAALLVGWRLWPTAGAPPAPPAEVAPAAPSAARSSAPSAPVPAMVERVDAADPRLLATIAVAPRWGALAELLPQSKQPELAQIAVDLHARVLQADGLDDGQMEALIAEQRQLSGYLRSRYQGFSPITDELDAIDAGLRALPAAARPLTP